MKRIVVLIFVLLFIASIALWQLFLKEPDAPEQGIIWVKDKNLELTWEPPKGGCDHYRIEILKNDLFAEPVTTSLTYEYSESNRLEIELMEYHSYSFRIQAVTKYGELSDYSVETPIYIYDAKRAQPQTQLTSETPSEFSLSQNYPNPFNGTTTIEYQIPHIDMEGDSVQVRLEICNTLGQRVKELVNEKQAPGKYIVTWNGRDDKGIQVASATYIYRLVAGNHMVSKKMIYLK